MQTSSTQRNDNAKAVLFAKSFGANEVSADMRAIAEWFCTHFDINGLCDPMYIANVSAVELDVGDGMGNFTGASTKGDVGAFERLATRLMGSYRTCVYQTHPDTTAELLAQQLLTEVLSIRDEC